MDLVVANTTGSIEHRIWLTAYVHGLSFNSPTRAAEHADEAVQLYSEMWKTQRMRDPDLEANAIAAAKRANELCERVC